MNGYNYDIDRDPEAMYEFSQYLDLWFKGLKKYCDLIIDEIDSFNSKNSEENVKYWMSDLKAIAQGLNSLIEKGGRIDLQKDLLKEKSEKLLKIINNNGRRRWQWNNIF